MDHNIGMFKLLTERLAVFNKIQEKNPEEYEKIKSMDVF